MAHIELQTDHVEVHLSPLDEVLALHGSLHLPYVHITSIVWERAAVHGTWLAAHFGTDLPGVKLAGTFFTGDGTVFYDFHDPDRCLTFGLDHEHYQRVVVQVDADQDPKDLVNRIAARIHRTGGPDPEHTAG